jgi:predicted Zn-dependent peptidase
LSHEALFPDHSLGREVAGTVDTIEAMRRDDIAGFFEQWYRPANIVVAAAGDVDHDAVVHAVGEHFAALDAGSRPTRSAPAGAVRLDAHLERPTEQAHVVLGWRGPDAHDPDRHALALLNHVLGGGMSSRLFEKIREERGLAYSVYSYSALYDDAGCLVAYAGTSPAHQAEVRDLMAATIAEVAAGGISERELEVAKGYVRGALLLGLEDSASRMSRLGANTLVHGSVMGLDEYLACIDAVTTDAVARVAAGILAEPPSVATIAPRAGRRRG